MASSPEIVVKYTADTKALSKGLNDVKRSSGGIGKALKVGGAAAAAGLGLVAVGMKKVIGDASNLEESINAVNVTFGKSAKQVHEFSKVASTEAGLSMREFNELVTPVGASLQNVGYSADEAATASINLAKRAADMASVFNTDVSESLGAIQAGLRGEADPLERFGVGLSDAAVKAKAMAMGLAESEKALTAQDKAQARVNLLMEQTDRLAGDFKNTSDGLANAQRVIGAEFENISASIGSVFLPIAARAAAGVAGFLGELGKAEGISAKFRVTVDAISKVAKTGFEAIGKEIAKIDWEKVGRESSKAIILGFNALEGFAKAYNWKKFGDAVGKGTGDALANVNWGRVYAAAWKAQIAVINGAYTALFMAAWELSKAIVVGIGRGLAGLGAAVLAWIRKIPGWVASSAASAAQSAFSLGVSIVQGLINGISSLAGAVMAKIESVVLAPWNKAKSLIGAGSPSRLWAELGKWTIQGYILGITTEQPKLNQKTAEAMQKALDAARATVERSQASFTAAFDRLGEFAARAFEGKTAAILERIGARFDFHIARWQRFADQLTPAEKQLEAMAKAEEERSRQAAVVAANAAVAAATTEAERVAAVEQLRQANLANERAALEAQAAIERTQQEKRAAEETKALEKRKTKALQNAEETRRQAGEKLDEQLANLRERLAKHPEEHEQIQKKIVALLKRYGIPFKQAGENLGKAFAQGLRESANEVEQAAHALARIVARYLPHSPAEKGPLARDDYFKGFGKMLASNMLGGAGALRGAAAMLAGAAVPRMASGAGSAVMETSGGGPVQVRVFIGETELTKIVRSEIVSSDTGLARTLLAGARV